MTNFQVGSQVRIKDPTSVKFGLARAERAFVDAGMIGVIERIETDLALMPYCYVVQTPDKSQHEFFAFEELELIEAGT